MNVRSVLPRDAIPSIDDPTFDDAYPGNPDDDVLVIDGSVPRAYPLKILSAHEIVKNVIDGVPIAVTWCPLCASAVVYDRRVGDRTLTFGVSGKLADDDLVMYDRETESEWKQSRGDCIAGVLEGQTLTARPAAIVPWRRFRRHHPNGTVLQPVGGSSVPDEDPLQDYFDADGFGLAVRQGREPERTWNRADLDAKTVVLGIVTDDEAVGYPRPRVEANDGVVTDDVGNRSVVVFATPDGIHAYANPGFTFDAAGYGTFRADGTAWDGDTGESDDGRQLERLPGRRMFAFAWQDDHGPDAFYES